MAAIDFPDSPSVGQEFTAAQTTWVWTGSVWQVVRLSPQGPTGPSGPTGPTGSQGPTGAFPTVLDGGTPFTEF